MNRHSHGTGCGREQVIDPQSPHVRSLLRIRRYWEGRPAELREGAIASTPVGRLAEPIDQANVVCFLASSHADFVTGVTIDVTGGA